MASDPAPLRPASTAGAGPVPLATWLASHALGIAALVIGAVAFVVMTLTQDALWSLPSWKLSVPFFMAALVAGVMALARREGAPALALGGIGLAAIAMVMGWFLVMAIIVVVLAILILILSMVM